jgi:hypothetical protein
MPNFAAYQDLLCPSCGNTGFMRVLETRSVPARNSIRRRRACPCGHRFTTYEYPEDTRTLSADQIAPTLVTLERTVEELKRRLL